MKGMRGGRGVDEWPVGIGKRRESGRWEDGTVMDYIGTVQAAQKAFVDSDACAAYVTVTDNLGYIEDGWHYDSDGFVRMGTAFAKAMVTLQTQCGFDEV